MIDFKTSLSEIDVNTEKQKKAMENIKEIFSLKLEVLKTNIVESYEEKTYLNIEGSDVKQF
jgi:hypothetical protein